MRNISTAAKVGLFATVTTVAGAMIYRFVDKSSSSNDGYVVYALINDAMGIAKSSQVRMAGIPVGTIQSVRLQGNRARVDIRMNPDVPLYDDAAMAKVMSSLLGEYVVTLSPGTEGKRKLHDGDQVHLVVDSPTTAQILEDVSKIAKDVQKVSRSLAESLGTDRGRDDMKSILGNLAQVTESLNQTVRENRDTIRSTLNNIENITNHSQPELQKILENVRVLTGDVREMLGKPDVEGRQPGDVREIVNRVNSASKSLESALQNIDSVTGRLERGEGTLGKLTKDEHLINEVEGVAETVGEFVGGLDRLQTYVGLRSDYLFLTGSVKSYVELRLQPREDKYYLIEIVNDPRGLTRFEQVDVRTTNPNDPAAYREVRTVTTNDFRFSLQFAQKFGPFTGRFGIKESTGGTGLDLHLFQERFELRQDLFGFGEVVLPRWRVSLGYEFVNRLWLMAGVDDILSPDRRDYFVGMQLLFNDEDLKSVLPFAKAP